MLTRPEAADPAVEELKRRARRRLVGAIVLALAAAVILPLLLESDPKPLGDDVSIRIPPIDNSKFITPLSPAKGADGKAVPNQAGAGTSTSPPSAAAAPDAAVEAKPAGALNASGKPVETAQRAATDVAPSPCADRDQHHHRQARTAETRRAGGQIRIWRYAAGCRFTGGRFCRAVGSVCRCEGRARPCVQAQERGISRLYRNPEDGSGHHAPRACRSLRDPRSCRC